MTTFRITVSDNLDGVRETFTRAIPGVKRFDRSRTADGREISLWGPVSQRWRTSRWRMFTSQGRTIGRLWSDYTSREAHHVAVKEGVFGRKVGRAFGDVNRWLGGRERLMPSFVSRSHPENVDRRGRTSLVLGSSVPYADDIDRGGSYTYQLSTGDRVTGVRPPRPLLRFGRRFREDLRNEVNHFAAEHTAGIGTQLGKSRALRQRGR